MCPAISRLPNILFYNGILKDGNKTRPKVIPPFIDNNIMFCHVDGAEERSSTGSLWNEAEANAVLDLLATLVASKVRPENIAVITPYTYQRIRLGKLLAKYGQLSKVEISSIHTFQGREKDYIIISCVRTHTSNIGFLRDPNLLNVALTRAKKGLIICGHAMNLSEHPYWNELVNYYYDKKVVFSYEERSINEFKGEINPGPIRRKVRASNLKQVLDKFKEFK
jgi:regulator of nonsense transcripts 1